MQKHLHNVFAHPLDFLLVLLILLFFTLWFACCLHGFLNSVNSHIQEKFTLQVTLGSFLSRVLIIRKALSGQNSKRPNGSQISKAWRCYLEHVSPTAAFIFCTTPFTYANFLWKNYRYSLNLLAPLLKILLIGMI